MKKVILLVLLLTVGFLCNAQVDVRFYTDYYYTPEQYAKAMENQALKSIRFDEYALSENPIAWENYLKYTELQNSFHKKKTAFAITGWAGLGIAAAGLLVQDDTLGPVLAITGGLAAVIGCTGTTIFSFKLKNNKKDFVYYLRATNNGVGIVTLF